MLTLPRKGLSSVATERGAGRADAGAAGNDAGPLLRPAVVDDFAGVAEAGGELTADGLGMAVDVAREGGEVLGFAIDFIPHGVVAAPGDDGNEAERGPVEDGDGSQVTANDVVLGVILFANAADQVAGEEEADKAEAGSAAMQSRPKSQFGRL